ncbi:MAG: hypothetical protein HC871_06165 [Rhizobiales bacterium]|nr:hypothetical protein [Hyphomicrobiales bacterium]
MAMMGDTVTAMADAEGASIISLACSGLDTKGPIMPARFSAAVGCRLSRNAATL